MNAILFSTAIAAVVGIAVIFGADVVAAVVLRPVYAGVDDRTLVQAVGRGHHFGDRRLPVAGVGGLVFAVATAVLAFSIGVPLSGAFATIGVLLLGAWLVLFARIAKPVNVRLSAAALAGEVPADARALQDRWESIITVRAILQGGALVMMCLVLVFA